MKRKYFKLCLLFILIISLILSIMIKRYKILFILLDVIIIIYFIGELQYRKFLKQRKSGLSNIDYRNYDKLIICDETYMKFINTDESTIARTSYNRNFYTDFLIVQRYYSYLKKDGEVIIAFDYKNYNYFNSQKIDSMDYPFLHVITLMENNINPDGLIYKIITEIINCYKILFYKLGIYKIRIKKDCSMQIVKDKIKYLYDFLQERELKLSVFVKNAPDLAVLKHEFKDVKFEKI